MKDKNKKEALSNRDKKLQPRLGRGWCYCDLKLVGSYEKCPVCKRRNGRKRFKK